MSNAKYSVETVGEKIADFLDAILDAADFDIDYEIMDGEDAGNYFEKPSLVVKFSGGDLKYLMANKGEGLLALEQLTQELLKMDGDEHALLCFDANDYRLLRQEELRISALTVAEQVRQGGNPFRFNPMTSRERRIIHLALRDAADLRSESSGTGPYRHVVVYPAGMPSLPEPPPPPPSARRGGERDRGGDRRDDRGGRGPRPAGGDRDRGGDRNRRGNGRPPRRGRR